MPGSLNDILTNPIGDEDERILLDHLKRKIRIAAEVSVMLLRAMEERFGPEARQVVAELVQRQVPMPRVEAGDPEVDLRAFCASLDAGCAGTHRWERTGDEASRIAYRYTRCMWAEVFRELGEPELGLVLCAGDEPAVKAWHPRFALERTKVMMAGDELCDHIFYVD